MNIYICSTVRHLLFALCKANSEPHQQHYLLFFADYQGASLSDWNLADLPVNIHIASLSRAKFRRQIEQTLAGWLSYQYSRALWSAPQALRKPVTDVLASTLPVLARQLAADEPFTLWLFNDRNRMARVFRLLRPRFKVIEDGESNYIKYRLSWWKALARLMRGQTASYRCIGDDPRCEEIWVSFPECLASSIRSKGRAIRFLGTESTTRLVMSLMGNQALPVMTRRSVILATQPIDGMATMSLAGKQAIYETIVGHLAARGCEVILKLHPAENSTDYEFLGAKTRLAPAKVPLEALLLSANERPLIVSVSSSAGLGFEGLCTRIKLIDNNDFATIRRWAAHPEDLRACLEGRLAGDSSEPALVVTPATYEQPVVLS